MGAAADWLASTPEATQRAIRACWERRDDASDRAIVDRWVNGVLHDADDECFQVLAEHIGQVFHCSRHRFHSGTRPPRRLDLQG